MPKVTLTFTVPEERYEMETAVNAVSFKCAIEDFDNYLRNIIKYTDLETVDPEEVRAKLHECLNDNDCSLR
jgi:hypothetical protein